MDCSTLGLPAHHQLPESMQTHVHRVGDAIQPSHPLSSPSPPAINLSQHQSLFIESALRIRWPKYWSFSFNISPSNEHPRQISFRMDWLDLLAVQGTLKSLLQHHSSKASSLWHSAFREGNGNPLQYSCSVVSDSLGPHELQHARPPCPSQTPRVHANPCPSSR